jgi:type I restriction enzyme M protein
MNDIKSKILSIFAILRSEGSNYEDNHVVLFLLSTYKDDLLNDSWKLESSNIIEEIGTKLIASENLYFKNYIRIFEVYKDIVDRISLQTLDKILKLVFELDKSLLKENFTKIFEETLEKIVFDQSRTFEVSILPQSLSIFMCSLVSANPTKSVYIPFSGINSFGIQLKQYSGLITQEVNQTVWALSILRYMAHKIVISSKFECENPLINWPKNQKFDLIISNPPLNVRLGEIFENSEFGSNTVESFLIEKGLNSLSDVVKMVVLIGQSFLNDNLRTGQLKEFLVNKGHLETIIILPEGLLNSTRIATAILVIRKSTKDSKSIKMIDTRSFEMIENLRTKSLKFDVISSILSSDLENPNLRSVGIEEVIENDYNLSVPRYFLEKPKGVKLRDLLTQIRGNIRNLPDTGKFVRIRDLKDDALDVTISADKLETQTLSQNLAFEVNQSCLMIASRWRILKPTLFNFEGIPIYVSRDIFCFEVNESIVDTDFLISELQSENVKKQLEAYQVGSFIPMIRREDFLNIVISIPENKEQQRQILIRVQEEALKAKEKETGLDLRLAEFKENYTRDLQSLKHSVRQYLSPLRSNISGTRKFLKKNEGKPIFLNQIFSETQNITLESHLDRLDHILNSINTLLNSDGFEIKNIQQLALQELIKEAVILFSQENYFTIENRMEESNSINEINPEDLEITPIISIAKDDFMKIISNVISNAKNHGFRDQKENNLIRVTYRIVNEYIHLELSNNGTPMPITYDTKKLTTRGEKTSDSLGTGIGGSDIKLLMDTYGGELELVNNPTEEFPVTYILKFPFTINA